MANQIRIGELKGATASWGEAQLRFAALAADVFPRAYEPAGVASTQHGVTLRVLRVAHTAESTAVQVEVTWAEESWYLRSPGNRRLPTLSDDLGHVYSNPVPRTRSNAVTTSQQGAVTTEEQVVVAQPGTTATLSEPGRAERTLAFAPVSTAARRVTLAVEGIAFDGASPYNAGTPCTLDLGADTHAGQRWQLDQWLDVEGFPVHLTGARLEGTSVQYSDGKQPAFALKFELDPLPEREGASLESVTFFPGRDGAPLAYGSSAGDDRQAPAIQFAQLPAGVLSLTVQPQGIVVAGQWNLTWDMPLAHRSSRRYHQRRRRHRAPDAVFLRPRRRPAVGGLLHRRGHGARRETVPRGSRVLGAQEPCDFLLGFAVGDLKTGAVEPGTYHVTIEGIVVAVPGPWWLSWDVPSH